MSHVDSVLLRDVSIVYSTGIRAAEHLSLSVSKGQFVSIVGPSGCGKSTLLNAIARLLDNTLAKVSGAIEVRAERIGYVFQRDTLLPWRSILQNVEVGLEIKGYPKGERKEIAHDLLAKFGLAGSERMYPHQLSGGMRQRVSLARTLAYNPDVILMDEPFASLDAQTRILLQGELLKIWEETRKTIVFVTHDLAEAITLSQKTVLLSSRPSTIKAEYDIDLPNPRDSLRLRNNKRFLEIHSQIWDLLSAEVIKQAHGG